jgi:hypothetical protein
MKLKNDAGESSIKSDTIQYIEITPVLKTFAINNIISGVDKTTSNTVKLYNTTDVKPTHYMASESPTFAKAKWLSYSTSPSFTLSRTYGIKKVYLKVKNNAGVSNVLSDTIEYAKSMASGVAPIPEQFTLEQNYPNPFNPETWIPYQLNKDSKVTIQIYSISGELIRKLDLGNKSAGLYLSQDRSAYWDGKNEAGEYVSSGLYFYTIQAGDFTAIRKMTVTK